MDMSCRARPLLVGIFFLLVATAAQAQAGARWSAPYFEAYSDGKRVEALPLAMTKVDVLIGGVIAEVSLTQVYENRGEVPVEAG